jgi:hypothetical protein
MQRCSVNVAILRRRRAIKALDVSGDLFFLKHIVL